MEGEIQAQIPNIDHVLSEYSVVSTDPVKVFGDVAFASIVVS
jgi:hypothetical protein